MGIHADDEVAYKTDIGPMKEDCLALGCFVQNVRIHGEFWRVSGPCAGVFSTAADAIVTAHNLQIICRHAIVHICDCGRRNLQAPRPKPMFEVATTLGRWAGNVRSGRAQ